MRRAVVLDVVHHCCGATAFPIPISERRRVGHVFENGLQMHLQLRIILISIPKKRCAAKDRRNGKNDYFGDVFGLVCHGGYGTG